MRLELSPEQRRKSIKIWLSDEERILVEAKAEYYGYKRLAPYIRDAAIYEVVTNAEIKGKQKFFKAYNETAEYIKQIAKDVRHLRIFATQFTENQRQELLKAMQDIYRKQKQIIQHIDKKIDLHVWKEVNHYKDIK